MYCDVVHLGRALPSFIIFGSHHIITKNDNFGKRDRCHERLKENWLEREGERAVCRRNQDYQNVPHLNKFPPFVSTLLLQCVHGNRNVYSSKREGERERGREREIEREREKKKR